MHIHTLVLGIAHICIILAILAQAFMLSILSLILKTHPPGPMLIATKSWSEVIRPRVIELWEGASTPCPTLGQGEYVFAGSESLVKCIRWSSAHFGFGDLWLAELKPS